MYLQVANNNHDVRIIIISVVLFECSSCTVTGSSFLIVCMLGIVLFCVRLHELTYNVFVWCQLFLVLPYVVLSCVVVERL